MWPMREINRTSRTCNPWTGPWPQEIYVYTSIVGGLVRLWVRFYLRVRHDTRNVGRTDRLLRRRCAIYGLHGVAQLNIRSRSSLASQFTITITEQILNDDDDDDDEHRNDVIWHGLTHKIRWWQLNSNPHSIPFHPDNTRFFGLSHNTCGGGSVLPHMHTPFTEAPFVETTMSHSELQ